MPTLSTSPQPLFTPAHQKAPYSHYEIRVRYITSNGNLQLPLAPTAGRPLQFGNLTVNAPLLPTEIVPTRQPASRKIVSWLATRMGLRPAIPNPYIPSNPNLVLEYTEVSPLAPILSGDGLNRIYRIQGVYIYLCRYPLFPPAAGGPPLDPTRWLYYPGGPYDASGLRQNLLANDDFIQEVP